MEIRNQRTLSSACAPERDPPPCLTARELDVLNGMALGLSDREIALRLMLLESTVRVALRSLCRKLRVRSRKEVVAYAAARQGGG